MAIASVKVCAGQMGGNKVVRSQWRAALRPEQDLLPADGSGPWPNLDDIAVGPVTRVWRSPNRHMDTVRAAREPGKTSQQRHPLCPARRRRRKRLPSHHWTFCAEPFTSAPKFDF